MRLDFLFIKLDFPIRLSCSVGIDLDGDFLVQALEKIKQLVGCEPAVMAVHRMGHIRLSDAEDRGDFTLFQFSPFKDLVDMQPDLRSCKKLICVYQSQIGE